MTPGELLRELRRRHGLTQRQLAARANTSQAAISRIERDVVSPSVATLASLLELMGERLVLGTAAIDGATDRARLRGDLERTAAAAERIAFTTSFSSWVQRQRATAGEQPPLADARRRPHV